MSLSHWTNPTWRMTSNSVLHEVWDLWFDLNIQRYSTLWRLHAMFMHTAFSHCSCSSFVKKSGMESYLSQTCRQYVWDCTYFCQWCRWIVDRPTSVSCESPSNCQPNRSNGSNISVRTTDHSTVGPTGGSWLINTNSGWNKGARGGTKPPSSHISDPRPPRFPWILIDM